ncbi:MAG: hotdog domain-containing protein [Peptoniphilaceae bacterium]|nr:hotdog domain-containing protein [Peptoniphilaceae bacterium]
MCLIRSICWKSGGSDDARKRRSRTGRSKKEKDRDAAGAPSRSFLFGGMIAMIFDCHGTASAAWFAHHHKGLTLTKDTVIGRFITARLEIDFRAPTPMNEEITVTSHLEELGERKVIVTMEMAAAGALRAKARMVAVGVKDTM